MPIIEARALTKAYGLLPVLRGLNLAIERGESVALLGANGAGKSTFIRLLTGLTRPTDGLLTIGGWQMPEEAAAVRAQIGLVSHRLLLYDNLTARENLTFFGQLYHLPAPELEQRIKDLLVQVGLSKRGYDLVRTFSRGMQQRLSIARALLHNPDILLLDEPHTGLDRTAVSTLDHLLNEARTTGRTVLMATHQFDKAVELTNRVVILARGVVAYDAPTDGLDAQSLAEIYMNRQLIQK